MKTPMTLSTYLIIQILPVLPMDLEDQLFLGHLEDLFCLLHLVGLLAPEYHVAPIENRKLVSRKTSVLTLI